uniref:Uncharacterized protein n=1 Tax=Caenorhabditis japonica TaxID=281687 RepID=A0A8R1DIQ0_CAEJA
MSSTLVRLLLLTILVVTVTSYGVLSVADQEQRLDAPRFWPSIPDFANDQESVTSSEFDGRIKRGLDDIEQQLSKRTNLKRLVILSARGFGKK